MKKFTLSLFLLGVFSLSHAMEERGNFSGSASPRSYTLSTLSWEKNTQGKWEFVLGPKIIREPIWRFNSDTCQWQEVWIWRKNSVKNFTPSSDYLGYSLSKIRWVPNIQTGRWEERGEGTQEGGSLSIEPTWHFNSQAWRWEPN